MTAAPTSHAPAVRRYEVQGLSALEVDRTGLTELHIACVPPAQARGDPSRQARELYAVLGGFLSDRGALIAQERVFGSLSARSEVLDARRRELPSEVVHPTYVEGAPCGLPGLAGVVAYAIAGPPVRPVQCEADVRGIAFDWDECTYAYVNGLVAGPTVLEMFAAAERYLRVVGLEYADVYRTWVYLADILDWYNEFNIARSAFYRSVGFSKGGRERPFPASTGIEGRPPGSGRSVMDVAALGGAGRERVRLEAVHNPLQNEATDYGSDFSRGIAVAARGVETLHISGTAAVDECGRTACVGDLHGQVARTIENVEALLGTRGMDLGDVCAATVFVKEAADEPTVLRLLREQGGPLARGVVVRADVCRHDLLFEVDAVAVRVVEGCNG